MHELTESKYIGLDPFHNSASKSPLMALGFSRFLYRPPAAVFILCKATLSSQNFPEHLLYDMVGEGGGQQYEWVHLGLRLLEASLATRPAYITLLNTH